MKFSIVTPSFNQLEYLKRCVASVRDQTRGCMEPGAENIKVHHHVQDGGSTDGTVEFLEKYDADVRGQMSENSDSNAQNPVPDAYSFSFSSEKDEGMYDALNKGFNHATGDVLAWLNCDEQYLPESLAKVAAFFARHPCVDILFGGMLMVNVDGELFAYRKAMPMRRLFLEASYLYNFSCAMFVRRDFWTRAGGFNPDYKNAGDEEWVRRALSCEAQTAVLRDYLSAFTFTDDNLSSADAAMQEHEDLKCAGSEAGRALKLPINLLRLAEKAFRGGWIEHRSLSYRIYVDPQHSRRLFEVSRPSCRWPDQRTPYFISHRLK